MYTFGQYHSSNGRMQQLIDRDRQSKQSESRANPIIVFVCVCVLFRIYYECGNERHNRQWNQLAHVAHVCFYWGSSIHAMHICVTQSWTKSENTLSTIANHFIIQAKLRWSGAFFVEITDTAVQDAFAKRPKEFLNLKYQRKHVHFDHFRYFPSSSTIRRWMMHSLA